MKIALVYLVLIFSFGCGSVNSALQSGIASYPNNSKQLISAVSNKKKIKTEFFSIYAYGCFANSPDSVDYKIISPAINDLLAKNHAIAAQNVKATRAIGATVLDVITFAWIWGCSYWDITGELVS